MKRQFHLLIIDPQNDFCDLPEAWLPRHPLTGLARAPALPVPGAHHDMLRLAALIAAGGQGLDAISVTLDSHHRYHIAHPTFWRQGDGAAVAPFTQIVAAEVRAGRYLPRSATALPRALAYLDALEAAGRYTLMVWPVHCEIGAWGHNVHDAVHAACHVWEDAGQRIVAKIGKGSNPWTESYSAIMAEVPDLSDPATQRNQALLDSLAQADKIFIAGEAGSHCVRATTEHIAAYFFAHFGAESLEKLVLIGDCMSAVAGFETQQRDFLADLTARGAQLASAADVLPQWQTNRDS